MINTGNMQKLYECLLDEDILTSKTLKSCGFNTKDIKDLVDNGNIERIKRGYYNILDVGGLFNYGMDLFNQELYDKALFYFNKCLNLDSTNIDILHMLFLINLKKENYDEAFKYFELFYDLDMEDYDADNNLYLYLLNIITEVPEKYKTIAKFLKYDDFELKSDNAIYDNIEFQNNVRSAIQKQKFVIAIKQYDYFIDNKEDITIHDVIMQTLLDKARIIQIENKRKCLSFVNNEEYDKLIAFLEELRDNNNVSLSDIYNLILAKELLQIMNYKIIPEKSKPRHSGIFAAIDAKNYELACSLSEQYNKYHEYNLKENAMYLLLNRIVEEINKLKHKTTNNTKKTLKETNIEYLVKTTDDLEKTVISESLDSVTYLKLINYLRNGDIEIFLRGIKNYLDSIKKTEYEILVVDLLKIDTIKGDYIDTMTTLTCLSSSQYKFDISIYVKKFFESISLNNYEFAKVYLDIINKYNSLMNLDILVDDLNKILEGKSNIEYSYKNEEVLEEVTVSKAVEVKETIRNSDIEPTPIQEVNTNNEKNSSYAYNLVSKNLDNVYKEGIVLLKPMNAQIRKEIHETVNNIADVISFSIGNGDLKRVVLRFKPYIDEYIDIPGLIKESTDTYREQKYAKCIEICKKLLQVGNPTSMIYGKMGLCYKKIKNKEKAIDYLTIATELGKVEGNSYDFTAIIETLKGNVLEVDKKAYVKMDETDFQNDLNEYYGIDNIMEIAELISTGLSIEAVCQRMELDDEQRLKIYLIYAREYYSQGNYSAGDQYVKIVEKTKDKPKSITSLYNEIRQNKRFYVNRSTEDHVKLLSYKK